MPSPRPLREPVLSLARFSANAGVQRLRVQETVRKKQKEALGPPACASYKIAISCHVVLSSKRRTNDLRFPRQSTVGVGGSAPQESKWLVDDCIVRNTTSSALDIAPSIGRSVSLCISDRRYERCASGLGGRRACRYADAGTSMSRCYAGRCM